MTTPEEKTQEPVPAELQPVRAAANELTLREVQRPASSQPLKLSELTGEFQLFTPALLVLSAKLDVDPVAYAAGQTGVTDIFVIESPTPFLDLPAPWDRSLWAVPHEHWNKILIVLGRLVMTSTPQKRYAKVLYHDLRVPDVLDKGLHARRPEVTVCAFAVDANFGCYILQPQENGLPKVISRGPRTETVREAEALFAVRKSPNERPVRPTT